MASTLQIHNGHLKIDLYTGTIEDLSAKCKVPPKGGQTQSWRGHWRALDPRSLLHPVLSLTATLGQVWRLALTRARPYTRAKTAIKPGSTLGPISTPEQGPTLGPGPTLEPGPTAGNGHPIRPGPTPVPYKVQAALHTNVVLNY